MVYKLLLICLVLPMYTIAQADKGKDTDDVVKMVQEKQDQIADGELDLDFLEDDQGEEEEYIEDRLGQEEEVVEGAVDEDVPTEEDQAYEEAPAGDATGDLDAEELKELTDHKQEDGLVRDEEGALKGIQEDMDGLGGEELEELSELLEKAEAIKEKIEEEAEEEEAAIDGTMGDKELKLKPIGEGIDPVMTGDDQKLPNADEDLLELDEALIEKMRPKKPAGKQVNVAALREKQRRIRKLARLRAMQKDFNGTLTIDKSVLPNPDHDQAEFDRVRARAAEILKKNRLRKKYSRGKHKLTATVKIDPMITVKGGKFKMGVNDPSSKTGEYPVRNMAVKPFKLDRYPVTNGDYAIFKQQKWRYQTDAEKTGSSWVFYTHMVRNATRNESNVLTGEPWWFNVVNATWDKPGGPGSEILSKTDHPVVHVSYHDAYAFCVWAGKRLPTEYEWEYACRGSKSGIRYPWGDRFERNRTNLWQGLFPMENKKADGYDGTSPVNAYKPQNDYGLYDMCGNVWEWTSTQWNMPRKRRNEPVHVEDPDKPKRFVLRGGSFIDSRDGTVNYEARCGNRKPMQLDFSSENIGFRCAQTINIDPRRQKTITKTTTPKPKPKKREPKVHRKKDTWSYKMKAMLEDIMEGGKETAESIVNKLKKFKAKRVEEL